MGTSPDDLQERFSRQVLLAPVGPEGQARWGSSSLFLAGEGAALEAAATALATSGVSRLAVASTGGFDASALASPHPGFQVRELQPDPENLPPADLYLIATDDAGIRRGYSRRLRREGKPALFAWCTGGGYALFLTDHGDGCPCLECFEILNPKAFGRGTPDVQRMAGALAATEALQWLLHRKSDLSNRVWVTSLKEGVSFLHDVSPTYKCPARTGGAGAAP